MRVLVLGSSGILGQHMRLCVPDWVTPIWHRRAADYLHVGGDLEQPGVVDALLDQYQPEVVINLAGESNPDAVERNPGAYAWVNIGLPTELARRAVRLVHVSSQAALDPVNAYGRQKLAADQAVLAAGQTVARPTFVLGIRPLPHVGRTNPAEQILGGQRQQVNDRWFSSSFAWDAARALWAIAQYDPPGCYHIGNPVRVSRYEIARALECDVEPVSHDTFAGLAPRPLDTTYSPATARWFTDWHYGVQCLRAQWENRKNMDVVDRAREIALFLGLTEKQAYERLAKGFGYQHAEVTADFNRANPRNDGELLEWYRRTEAYIWELSAYHCARGFNYMGMCQGVCERLQAAGVRRVLVLGDGIGDLTLALQRAGMDAYYHDLAGSRTAAFALFRLERHGGRPLHYLTDGWSADLTGAGQFDAVCSADFLEHVTDVPAWVAQIKAALAPGGFLFSQNAFGIGSEGSMPMHLKRNDRWEKEWDPLLASLEFRQESSNWYRKAA